MLDLEKIRSVSSILTAALEAVLHGRSLRAKRFLWCCGMNTDQLIEALIDAVTKTRLELMSEMGFDNGNRLSVTMVDGGNSRDFAKQVLKLLQRISQVKLGELLLSASTREFVSHQTSKADRCEAEQANCRGALKLWLGTEILCDQVESMLTRGVRIKHDFIAAINDGIGSLDELLVCLKEFSQRDQAIIDWLKDFTELRDKFVATKEKLEGEDDGNAAGRQCALALLKPVAEHIETVWSQQQEDSGGLSLEVRNLQAQRQAICDLLAASSQYRKEFSAFSYRVNAQIGDGVLKLMLQCVQALRKCLVEDGITLWSSCAQYMQKVGAVAAVVALSTENIGAEVTRLIDKLNEQQRVLEGFNGTNGITIKVGLSVGRNSPGTLSDMITQVTDFLQANAATVPVAPPPTVATAVEESRSAPDAAAKEEPAGMDVTDVHITVPVEGGKIEMKLMVDLNPESPAAAVAEVSDPLALSAVHQRFFVASPFSLTEEQKDRINEFLGKLKDCASFTDKQLDSVCRYLTDLVERRVTDADRTIFPIATKLGVTVRWIDEHEIREKIGELLNPIASAPSPQ